MARWTESVSDQRQVAVISQQMPVGFIVKITLCDGNVIEGVLRRVSAGNNAGRGGWKYYGECEIEMKDRKRWVIDYLDIQSVVSISNDQVSLEYEQLGLITMLR